MCYNFVPWSLLKVMAPKSDLLIISLSLDVFLFCTHCSNCQTLIHPLILLLNAFLSSLTNSAYRITQNAFGIQAKLIAISFFFFFFFLLIEAHFTSLLWLRGYSNQRHTELHWTKKFMVIQFAPREGEMEMSLLCDIYFCSFWANDPLCLCRKWLLWICLWLDGWYTVYRAEKGTATLEINRKQNSLC